MDVKGLYPGKDYGLRAGKYGSHRAMRGRARRTFDGLTLRLYLFDFAQAHVTSRFRAEEGDKIVLGFDIHHLRIKR